MADPMPPEDGYRYFSAEVGRFRAELRDLQQADGSQQAQAVRRLAEAVAAIPIMGTGTASASGFALASGWPTLASVSVPVPAGKTVATCFALGVGAALDATTGGVTSLSGRVVIHGEAGVAVPGTKDAGASQVNNVITASHSRTISGVSGSVTASVQMSPLNATAFPARPGNVAQITLFVSFSA
ncbi:hypothetical protein GCM10022198_00130 [Klugiella xanthotipulae]|uniref:Uncharacterized protein n=1 Tax=Klugiella xanthotipulae TaxID=244735 RepID=A0A543I5F8_9MICO|nr:hypothetical protein [Klugiella xanthotipulae]TQM65846.1 hypothetical protein FB466_0660 [Klugiella xanthotipulae]